MAPAPAVTTTGTAMVEVSVEAVTAPEVTTTAEVAVTATAA